MKIFYVYILECSDKTFYTGITANLSKRVESHANGKYRDSYTFSRRPIKLVFFCEFTDPNRAIGMEKQIKRWSRAKKQALIDGNYDQLPNLAKKKF
ncbi:GIY-YIG nuclease family protein [Ulvibacterium sp.]|uniref:GIY-YIG nuclease family protein n=1 Tax=Ulvibacterium sp. TaxID=2665914 RepID=UPI003BA9CB62